MNFLFSFFAFNLSHLLFSKHTQTTSNFINPSTYQSIINHQNELLLLHQFSYLFHLFNLLLHYHRHHPIMQQSGLDSDWSSKHTTLVVDNKFQYHSLHTSYVVINSLIHYIVNQSLRNDSITIMITFSDWFTI